MKQFFLLTIMILGFSPSFAQPENIDLEAAVMEISEAIDLDEAQTQALAKNMQNYAMSLKEVFDKDDTEEEPNPQAMIGAFKSTRETYHAGLKADIGDEKFNQYLNYTEQVKMEVLTEVAGLRLLDLQNPLKLSDGQIEQLKPVMATAMRDIMGTLVEYGDRKMNLRTKLKVGNAVKKTKKDMEAKMMGIMSEQQFAQWQAMMEEKKKQKKGK